MPRLLVWPSACLPPSPAHQLWCGAGPRQSQRQERRQARALRVADTYAYTGERVVLSKRLTSLLAFM